MAIRVLAVNDTFLASDEDAIANKLNLTGWMRRIDSQSFSTDITSSGTTEVVGYSHSVTLVSGQRYRVAFKCYVIGGQAAGQGRLQLRYDASTLTITSTAIGTPFGTICVSTSNGDSEFYWSEFVASGSGAFNMGVGVRTGTGTGNTVIQGTTIASEYTVDAIET